MSNSNLNRNKFQTPEDRLYVVGLCVLCALPVALALYRYLCGRLPFFGMPCILHMLTGYYCPGCGGTRAVDALLHLQLWRSFCYHPLIPYGAAVYVWFMLSHSVEKLSRHRLRIGMKWNPAWLWTALVILAVNVLVRDGALFFFGVDFFNRIF